MTETVLAAIAGLAAGLWIGEWGRRRDIRSMLEHAVGPIGNKVAQPPAGEAVELAEEFASVVEYQVEHVAAQLVEEALATGKEVSFDQARAEARRMLEEVDMVEGDPT